MPSRSASSSAARVPASAVQSVASSARSTGRFGGVTRTGSSEGSRLGVDAASASSPGAATSLTTS